jgi:hypothetical protein
VTSATVVNPMSSQLRLLSADLAIAETWSPLDGLTATVRSWTSFFPTNCTANEVIAGHAGPMSRNGMEGEYMFLRSAGVCGHPSGVCIHDASIWETPYLS